MKRSRVLEEADAEADVAYEGTRLAKRALRARKRLVAVLLAGALLGLVAAWLTGWAWLAATLALAATAAGIRTGRLGGVIAAALAALVGAMLALRLLLLGGLDAATLAATITALLLSCTCLPDIVTLLRDAELQHAYGLWARREGDVGR